MRKGNKTALIVFAIVAGVFVYELASLFEMGFTTGENYPVYSSLRSDPMGARAFFGALGSLPGITVRRNIEPITKIGSGRGKTLIIIGANTSEDPVDIIEALEAFVADGGRMVITFLPQSQKPEPFFLPEDAEDDKKKDEKKPEKKVEKPAPPEDDKMASIAERWGFSFEYEAVPVSGDGEISYVPAEKASGPPELPSKLSWYSAMYFKDDPGKGWQTLYQRNGHAVLMERNFGAGSIALFSDSYFVSNEAMRKDRYPALLAWLIGKSSFVIFDEVHLGIGVSPGMMTLIRGYRLQWLIGAFIVVALLFIWKNMTSLVPHWAEGENIAPSLKGKDSAAGLTNLLRRSIPADKSLSVCLEEWRASFARDPKFKSTSFAQAKAVADRERAKPATKRDPANAYMEIQTILSGRKQ